MPAVGSQRYAVPSVAAADGDQPALARLLNLSLSGQPLVARPRPVCAASQKPPPGRAGGKARPADLLLDGAGFYLALVGGCQ